MLSVMALIYAGLFAWPTIWKPFWRIITDASKKGLLPALALMSIGSIALPMDALHYVVTRRRSSPAAIELWVVVNLVLTLLFLMNIERGHLFLLLWPILRVSDTMATFLRVVVRGSRPRNPARSVVLLLTHYGEVVFLFAILYGFLQSRFSGNPVFLVGGKPTVIDRGQSVFLSFVTATTTGFGDITPSHLAPYFIRCLAYSSLWLELTVMLWITAIEIPRLIGANAREITPNPVGGADV